MTVCLDTNVFLQIFGRKQPFHQILRALLDGRLTLAVSNEILLEYEEVTAKLSGAARRAHPIQCAALPETAAACSLKEMPRPVGAMTESMTPR